MRIERFTWDQHAQPIFHDADEARDEEAGHPFRGNQYVTGESGAGQQLKGKVKEEEESTAPKSWDDLSSRDQERVESAWREEAYRKEIDYQEEEWRSSGEARHAAESEAADQWNGDSPDRSGWSDDALEEAMSGWKEDHGTDMPYTAEQLRQAIDLRKEYDEDMEVKFDDTKLQEPTDLAYGKGQLQLPGVEHADPSGHLTEKMREHLTEVIKEKFDDHATDVENYLEPPDFSESANETVDQIWHEMDDREKFNWAKENTDIAGEPDRRPPRRGKPDHWTDPPYPSAAFSAHVRDVVKKVVDDRILKDVKFDDGSSMQMSSIGLTRPQAYTEMDSGKITMMVRNLQDQSDKQLEGIVLHESMHRKFNDVVKLESPERERFKNLVGDEKYEDAFSKGELPEEYRGQFPLTAQMIKFEGMDAKDKMISEVHDHPVSNYSNMYWARASQNWSSDRIFTAIHETFAEMARRQHEEGKLPSNIPTWVDFYNTVNNLWEKTNARSKAQAHSS